MKRGAIVLDRFLTLLIGLVLIALGVGAAAWQLDRLPFTLDSLNLSGYTDLTEQGWWPWALGAGGVVVVLLGLALLVKQFPARRAPVVSLALPDGKPGSLLFDVDAVAARAADEASEIDGVKSARSRTATEKGLRVVTLLVTINANADVPVVFERLSEVRAGVAKVVEGTPLAVRVLVSAS
ncbi:hypothetical protein GCM10007304_05850 [Rhodococcoides trifolii]|uniref:Alkaline shock response membrane anchor protein AmaP n=1 Tax=Rhodococcoides trifolii TaxID=908250 RepID=A0A917FPJ8_9NOCA|nr:hypothetical protein [Rhodococcus trifolii]GGF94819.1 hypothetical protein GCM10007304_05850 [Rhodococcus trifolii]